MLQIYNLVTGLDSYLWLVKFNGSKESKFLKDIFFSVTVLVNSPCLTNTWNVPPKRARKKEVIMRITLYWHKCF